MKITLLILTISIILNVSMTHNLFSQCTNQITHLSGTVSVNGIDVSVTSWGVVDAFNTYCINTFPYFIGETLSGIGGDGSYSFSFSPPIDSLTLNFSGISDTIWAKEIVKLFINGSHYPIPSAGVINNCDPMAILTPSGDIAGCPGCGVSGWLGTTITGTISSLTVLDSLTLGTNAGGSLFSLFISDPGVNGLENQEVNPVTNFYPNPFSNEINVMLTNYEQAEIILYDITSRKILKQKFTNSVSLNTAQLAKGLYHYEVRSKDGSCKKGKVVKE